MRGIDIVKDKGTKEPYQALASRILIRALERGVILTIEGMYNNVIAITPPLTIEEAELTAALDILEGILIEENIG